jgi:hypothetical protein
MIDLSNKVNDFEDPTGEIDAVTEWDKFAADIKNFVEDAGIELDPENEHQMTEAKNAIRPLYVWETAYDYIIGHQVLKGNSIFVCISNHTSDVFYTDWLTNGYWIVSGDAPGHIKSCGRNSEEPGYLLCDGKTIGDDSSGADYIGDEYRDLYEYIQDNFGGTYNWSNHDTVNLPDLRGVFLKGSGTTDRELGKDANGNFYAGVFGEYLTDKMQGHKHLERGIDYVTSGTHHYALKSNPSSAITETDTENYTGVPVTDGVNGAPRTGLSTEPQSLGVGFIIKY